MSKVIPGLPGFQSEPLLGNFDNVRKSVSDAESSHTRFKTAADLASSGCFYQLETVFGTFLMSLKPATGLKLDAMES